MTTRSRLRAASLKRRRDSHRPVTSLDLGLAEQSSKRVSAWALEKVIDPDAIQSNTFVTVWPPNSGTYKHFPELDRAAYFTLGTAAVKIVNGQRTFLDRLREAIAPER